MYSLNIYVLLAFFTKQESYLHIKLINVFIPNCRFLLNGKFIKLDWFYNLLNVHHY